MIPFATYNINVIFTLKGMELPATGNTLHLTGEFRSGQLVKFCQFCVKVTHIDDKGNNYLALFQTFSSFILCQQCQRTI